MKVQTTTVSKNAGYEVKIQPRLCQSISFITMKNTRINTRFPNFERQLIWTCSLTSAPYHFTYF